MSAWSKAWATARFDFQRSLTPHRFSIVLVLSLFPPAIMAINLLGPGSDLAPVIIGVTVMMVGILAELLWATPIVYQELEGKTWTYLAVRPFGILALLTGKYLIAVAWTLSVCTAAMSLSVGLVMAFDVIDTYSQAGQFTSSLVASSDHLRTWSVFMVLIVLASFAYGAIFLLIGVLFHRRAMVFAMAYVIGLEGIVAQVPAVINQITMRHHLTALAIKWLDFDFVREEALREPVLQQMLGINEPDWKNVLILVVTTLVALAASVWIVRSREYITSEEV